MLAYLYKLQNCEGCIRALHILKELGYDDIKEYLIDNPVLEVGITTFFKDRQVHAPLIWIPDKGVYIIGGTKNKQLLRILNLEPDVPINKGA